MKYLKGIVVFLVILFFVIVFSPYFFIYSKTKKVVIDNTPPGLYLFNSKESIITGENFIDQGYKSFDDRDGDITDKVKVNSNLDNTKEGVYTIEYTSCDKSNNCTIKKREITVIDKNNSASKIAILTYHNFLTKKEKEKYRKNEKYTMNIERLEEQMKYLSDNGYNVIDLDTFYKWYTNKIELTKKNVVITIDDGNITSYKYAIPIIEKYGFKATIFVITGRIAETDGEWNPSTNRFLSKLTINDIIKNHKDISLESHSNSLHGDFNGTPTKDDIIKDLKLSKEILNASYFAYPFGNYGKEYTEAVKEAGYYLGFAFKTPEKASRNSDPFEIPRVNINQETSLKKFIGYLNQ